MLLIGVPFLAGKDKTDRRNADQQRFSSPEKT